MGCEAQSRPVHCRRAGRRAEDQGTVIHRILRGTRYVQLDAIAHYGATIERCGPAIVDRRAYRNHEYRNLSIQRIDVRAPRNDSRIRGRRAVRC